ncbi:MAG: hypothetical protein CL489_03280 [Acidobacteria bacterium]|nr:hypothetical protein [Acidobacteriota bacterium]|tara:strand:- start:1005 stop:1469 length:465 start_codon:yes stop_codon:yes gene_type:complete
MGQYHLVANIDRREFLHPHKFGEGFKLMEFGTGRAVPLAMTILLSASNGRGGGDFRGEGAGRWAGDRIAIIGDYFEEGDVEGLTGRDMADLWSSTVEDDHGWTDISEMVRGMLHLSGEVEFYLNDQPGFGVNQFVPWLDRGHGRPEGVPCIEVR